MNEFEKIIAEINGVKAKRPNPVTVNPPAPKKRGRGRPKLPRARHSKKQCTLCMQVKPRAMFSPNRAHADGLQSQCNECRQINALAARKMIQLNIAQTG